MKPRSILLTAASVLALAAGVALLVNNLKPVASGLKPALVNTPLPTALPRDAVGEEIPAGLLDVAEGYELRVFTRDIINPRVMIFDKQGRMLVSEPSAGRVSVLDGGKRRTLLDNLQKPHGLALDDKHFYVAETGQVLRFDYDPTSGAVSGRISLLDLPAGGRHWTRSLGIGPDGALYISIGSSCNICVETDQRRQKILRYDFAAQQLETFASGLRNAVYFAWQPDSGEMFATEMGRDWLGDDLPPDELDVIKQGADYGFPYCYGDNTVDPQYKQPERCAQTQKPLFSFGAHEAPLGIDFYQGDIYVALHGSWNRSQPVGYEVVRLSNASGFQERETVVSGWLNADHTSKGRPAGITTGPDGRLYISDDTSDVIYVLTKL